MHRCEFAERYLFIQVGKIPQNLEPKAWDFRDKCPPLPLTDIGQVNPSEPTFSLVAGGFECLLCGHRIMEIANIAPWFTRCLHSLKDGHNTIITGLLRSWREEWEYWLNSNFMQLLNIANKVICSLLMGRLKNKVSKYQISFSFFLFLS